METTIHKTHYQSFAMTSTHAKSFYELLHKRAGLPTVELEANCKDSASRVFHSVAELEEFDNTDNRKILKLDMQSISSQDDVTRIVLSFQSEDGDSTLNDRGHIHTYIKGQDEAVTYIDSQLCDKIDAMRPWYSKYTRLQGIHVFATLLIIVAITVNLMVQYGIVGKPILLKGRYATINLEESTFFILFGPLLLALLACLILGPIIYFLSKNAGKLRQIYFPSGAFLIGYQASIESARDKRRHSIVSWAWRSVFVAPFLVVGYAYKEYLMQLISS